MDRRKREIIPKRLIHNFNIYCKICSLKLTSKGYISTIKGMIYTIRNESVNIGENYNLRMNKDCPCVIRDISCISCGNKVGYYSSIPCEECSMVEDDIYIFDKKEIDLEVCLPDELIIKDVVISDGPDR